MWFPHRHRIVEFFLFVIIFLSCWNEIAPAQMATPASTRQPAAADFDQTLGMPPYVFRTYQFAAATPGKVRVEVYLGMVNDILQFVKAPGDSGGDEKYRAQYEVNLTVWDKKNNVLDSRNWKRELLVDDFNATNERQKLNLEQTAFELTPGEYEIALELTDRDTGKNLRDRRPLKISPRDDAQLQLSSIVFTKPIPTDWWKSPRASTSRDSLLLNFATVLMNVTPDFRAGAPANLMNGAGAYFEIYGAKAGETLQLEYKILDWRRQPVQEWQETLTEVSAPTRHHVDFSGKIKGMGSHTFQITGKRANSPQKAATAEENFQVQISGTQNYAAKLAENKALLFEPLRYIVKGAEYKRLVETTETGRDSLVAKFWRQRDPDPATSANQLKEEFYRRVAFADTRFTPATVAKSGWETDRGRIYIKYGPPREVHHQFAEQGAPPYEVWFYPDQDLAFIFRDKNGSGDFELVNR